MPCRRVLRCSCAGGASAWRSAAPTTMLALLLLLLTECSMRSARVCCRNRTARCRAAAASRR
eukprot:8351-Heterococcus_DN1.PRE.2